MLVVLQVLYIITASLMIVFGSLMIYGVVRKSRFGEGQTLQKINKVFSDNAIMKKALVDITGTSYCDDYFNLPDDADRYEYEHLITELKRDVARLQSKAYMALDLISEENEAPY